MPQNALVDVGAAIRAGNDIRQNEEINALNIDAAREQQRQQTRTFSRQEQQENTQFLFDSVNAGIKNPAALPQIVGQIKSRGIADPNFDFDALLQSPDLPNILNNVRSQLLAAGAKDSGFGDTFTDENSGALLQEENATGQVRQVASGRGGLFGGGETSEMRTFNALIALIEDPNTPEDTRNAAMVELGTLARAGSSADERIANTPGQTQVVADSQSQIAQAVEFGKKTGVARAETIDAGYLKIQSLDTNNRNIDKAIDALLNGAQTGAIEGRLIPSFREYAVKLDQLQAELALDVVGATTFGALSEGELDLAKQVALPQGLQPAALIEWLRAKKLAQQKLSQYFADQIDFLDQGGTQAGWLRHLQRGTPPQDPTMTPIPETGEGGVPLQGNGNPAPEGTKLVNAQGQTIVKQNGEWVLQ